MAEILRTKDGQSLCKAAIADLSWLAGTWQGEAFGGTAQEIWAPPFGGTMLGMYRQSEEGKVTMYELMALEPLQDGIVLRLHHFSPGLSPWDHENAFLEFPLLKLEHRCAYFNQVTYQLVKEDLLEIFLELPQEEGVPQLHHFSFELHG